MPTAPPRSDPIRFHHRGAVVEVAAIDPTRSVLDWLREDARCTGTKEGCNEGDCGACTVVLGELRRDAAGADALTLRSVNACMQFVPTLHGKALYTVESLQPMAADAATDASAGAALTTTPESSLATDPVLALAPTSAASASASAPATASVPAPASAPAPPHASASASRSAARRNAPLHPVQQALVDCHASQCGFCTPGFVMSLFALYERHGAAGTRPTRQQIADELSGNLCRCTGYRPILDAAERMFELPPVRIDRAALRAQLADLDALPTDGTIRRHQRAPGEPTFYAPRRLADFAALRAAQHEARVLAGCTDIGVWVHKQFRVLGDIHFLGDVAEMQRIAIESCEGGGQVLVIGAGATLEDAWRALAAHFDGLTEVWLRFASPPIRNAGTLGGNIANGSPIGDGPPVLIALDAEVELRHADRVRRLPLADFYTGYLQNQLQAGEFVQALRVPLPAADAPAAPLRVHKIAKRYDSDISALCAALRVTVVDGTVRDARLVYGGMAATVQRARAAEAALIGQPWTQASVDSARAALAHDFRPLTDLRASADYRLRVAGNLLQRHWLETRAADPLHPAQLSVWSVMPHQTEATAPLVPSGGTALTATTSGAAR